jgi:hypothetical protein
VTEEDCVTALGHMIEVAQNPCKRAVVAEAVRPPTKHCTLGA